MFTDDERNQLVAQMIAILEERKAGRADTRRELAELLVDDAREFLRGRYNAGNDPKDNKTGIWQTRDSLTKDDFAKPE